MFEPRGETQGRGFGDEQNGGAFAPPFVVPDSRHLLAAAWSADPPKSIGIKTRAAPHRPCVVVTAPFFVPYFSNHARKYSCVLRKFDGVLDVPWYSLFIRIIIVGVPCILRAR